ncbi:transglutaminase-like domain-containing protein [Variovorax terrae]|uniref:Transglutaminase family protein n=1 Tax=Variovorax terrae TaxID=2923278 RepID=A0A9X1VY92_9BURK|nr:transglutaminase family protein [Variovorax terrae]MCJ0765493.1 transglutaminase family protein [Variovorax terrae]
MVRLQFSVELAYEVTAPGTDFVFNIEAARTHHQRVLAEHLSISQTLVPQAHVDPITHNRYLRLQAHPGALRVRYDATVDLAHHAVAPELVGEVWVANLPGAVLPYLYPSRYCESDRLQGFALQHFGGLWQGYGRVMAIRDWVAGHVAFRSNTSDSHTSAVDTLAGREGVCRDFAHLMIALCRAVNIPARFATGIDYGADPALGPTDFHAYVEAYLGNRWYIFDPSGTAIPMGFVRFATGRDAADAAFATIFGRVESHAPRIRIDAVPDDEGHLVLPRHRAEALSTDAGAH